MDKVWNWIKARLSEPSTWLGLGAVSTAVGTALQGGHATWQTVLMAAIGSLAAVKGDPGTPPANPKS